MTSPSLVVSDTSPIFVLWAKAEGLIPSVREALNGLRRQAGIFLKTELIDEAARQAGEELADGNSPTPADPTRPQR